MDHFSVSVGVQHPQRPFTFQTDIFSYNMLTVVIHLFSEAKQKLVKLEQIFLMHMHSYVLLIKPF